jgi:hypothetical protein
MTYQTMQKDHKYQRDEGRVMGSVSPTWAKTFIASWGVILPLVMSSSNESVKAIPMLKMVRKVEARLFRRILSFLNSRRATVELVVCRGHRFKVVVDDWATRCTWLLSPSWDDKPLSDHLWQTKWDEMHKDRNFSMHISLCRSTVLIALPCASFPRSTCVDFASKRTVAYEYIA